MMTKAFMAGRILNQSCVAKICTEKLCPNADLVAKQAAVLGFVQPEFRTRHARCLVHLKTVELSKV